MLPWVFYDWSTGRHSGFVVSMLSQMGMMTIFALSLQHAAGAGRAVLVRAMRCSSASAVMRPSTLSMLAGDGSSAAAARICCRCSAGLSGLGLAIVFGYMATKQPATAFAMITLGIGELITTAALMFHAFLRRRGRRQCQPHDRPQPARPQIWRRDPGLLPDRGLDRDLGAGDALSHQQPLGRMANASPRQFRARAIHGLRPADGALPAIRAVRLFRRDRRRALRHRPTRS